MIFRVVNFCLRISVLVLPIGMLVATCLELNRISKYREDIASDIMGHFVIGAVFVIVCVFIRNRMLKSLGAAKLRAEYQEDYLLLREALVEEMSLGSRRIISVLLQVFFVVLSVCIISLCLAPFAFVAFRFSERESSDAFFGLLLAFPYASIAGYIIWKLLKLVLWIKKGYQ